MLTSEESEMPFILQAQIMGNNVITTGNNPNQIGYRYADEYIPFDYYNYERIPHLA